MGALNKLTSNSLDRPNPTSGLMIRRRTRHSCTALIRRAAGSLRRDCFDDVLESAHITSCHGQRLSRQSAGGSGKPPLGAWTQIAHGEDYDVCGLPTVDSPGALVGVGLLQRQALKLLGGSAPRKLLA